jgi:hypothetical protein
MLQQKKASNSLMPVAKGVAYCASSDQCTICMTNYANPVQTICGHVFCRLCLQAWLNVRGTQEKCPGCRANVGAVFYKPLFNDEPATKKRKAKGPPAPGSPPATADTIIGHAGALRAALKGGARPSSSSSSSSGEDEKKTVHSMPKMTAVVKIMTEFAARKQAKKQLVIFCMHEATARLYLDAAHDLHLKPGVAGLLGNNESYSDSMVEAAKSGTINMLILSYKFAVGYDLCRASDLVIAEFSRKTYLVLQAVGRVKRLGQVHSQVNVHIVTFKNFFDGFLFDNKTRIASVDAFTTDIAFQLEKYCTEHIKGSNFYELQAAFVQAVLFDMLEARITSTLTNNSGALVEHRVRLPTVEELTTAKERVYADVTKLEMRKNKGVWQGHATYNLLINEPAHDGVGSVISINSNTVRRKTNCRRVVAMDGTAWPSFVNSKLFAIELAAKLSRSSPTHRRVHERDAWRFQEEEQSVQET